MSGVPSNVAELVGGTPVLQLTKLSPNPDVELFAKLEAFNPGGSVKDRIGVSMIEGRRARRAYRAWSHHDRRGDQRQTRGSRWAFVCAAKGYELILTLPAGDEPRARGPASAVRARRFR